MGCNCNVDFEKLSRDVVPSFAIHFDYKDGEEFPYTASYSGDIMPYMKLPDREGEIRNVGGVGLDFLLGNVMSNISQMFGYTKLSSKEAITFSNKLELTFSEKIDKGSRVIAKKTLKTYIREYQGRNFSRLGENGEKITSMPEMLCVRRVFYPLKEKYSVL